MTSSARLAWQLAPVWPGPLFRSWNPLEHSLDLREVLLVAIRWSHAAAAVALVGGSAFYLFVLAPALRRAGTTAGEVVGKGVEAGFKELLDISIVVLVVSGGLLTFERLSSGAASTTYVIVLALKILVSVLLYRWALQVRRGRGWESREARFLVGSGFLVVFLATVLKTLYESNLHS
jgi:uncharacterized membrane protein